MSEKANKILYIVLSLLLAVVFWLFVDTELGNTVSEDFNNVPVVFIGAEDTLPSRGLMLAEGGDATVDLRLSGPRAVISDLKRNGGVRVRVNLTDINAVGPYSKTYELVTPDNVNNSDITVERRSRSAFSIQVTNLYSKEVQVSPSVIGEVAESYMYTAVGVVTEPSTITISGLRENVDPIASARVVVDITGATGTTQQEYSYELLDSDGNVVEDPDIHVSDQQVSVTVPVYLVKELPLTLKFKESAGSRLANAKWELDLESITVAGEPLNLETIDEIELAEIDLSASSTDWEEDLPIKIPAGCENISGQKTAHLTVKYRGLETKSFTVTNIKPSGLSVSQNFDLITTSVDVLLRGPAAELEQVTEEDIRIVVDLTDIASDGAVQPQAIVYVDGYSEVGAVGTYTVSGKIISS